MPKGIFQNFTGGKPPKMKKQTPQEYVLYGALVLTFMTGNLYIIVVTALLWGYALLSTWNAKRIGKFMGPTIQGPNEISAGEDAKVQLVFPRSGPGTLRIKYTVSIQNEFTGENVTMPGKIRLSWLNSTKDVLKLADTHYGTIRIRVSNMETWDFRKKIIMQPVPTEPFEISVNAKSANRAEAEVEVKEGEKLCLLYDNVKGEGLIVTPMQKERQAAKLFTLSKMLIEKNIPHTICFMESEDQAVMMNILGEDDLKLAERKLAEAGQVPSGISSLGTFMYHANLSAFNHFYFITSGDTQDIDRLKTMGEVTVVSAGLGRAEDKL